MALANTRHIRIRPSADNSELAVPADVVAMFGSGAELELKLEPGQVTIRRADASPPSDLSRTGKVLKGSREHPPPLPRPLTGPEREAVAAFLSE